MSVPYPSLDDQFFDIAIFCALYEEAEAVCEVFASGGWPVYKQNDPLVQRDYFYCRGKTNAGADLGIYITWLPSHGPVSMAIHAERVLGKHKTLRLLLMTGICAGDKAKVHLGDLVIARGVYHFDAGKAQIVDNAFELAPDPDYKSMHDRDLQRLWAFDSWRELVASEPRPRSRHHQRDTLIRKLLETPSFTDIPTVWLEEHAPAWQRILEDLRRTDDKILGPDNTLVNPDAISERVREKYSFVDPTISVRHICDVASTAMVREDRPFQNVRRPVRKTFAIDMEGHSFYKVAQDYGKLALFVKGVCDYADEDKDDSYHKYAARVSALFALALLRGFTDFPGSEILLGIAEPRAPEGSLAKSTIASPTDTADRAVPFWHTVKERIAVGKDVGSLIALARHHVVITGLSLTYVIRHCRSEVLAALTRNVAVCIILPESTPDSHRLYKRYAAFIADDLPAGYSMYRTLHSDLSAAQKRSFLFVSTPIPLTHSIGLYDGVFYVNEFCIDHSSSKCPSFSLVPGSHSYDVMVSELYAHLTESSVICGKLSRTLKNIEPIATYAEARNH